VPNSPGPSSPAPEKETRGGTWRLRLRTKTNQKFSGRGTLLPSGIRNGEGFAIDAPTEGCSFTQHGRDQLAEDWQQFYKGQIGSELQPKKIVSTRTGS